MSRTLTAETIDPDSHLLSKRATSENPRDPDLHDAVFAAQRPTQNLMEHAQLLVRTNKFPNLATALRALVR